MAKFKCTQNLGFECMHLIGKNKQSKFPCNALRISPVTMTCAELCCQTTWGHISQLLNLPNLGLEEGI